MGFEQAAIKVEKEREFAELRGVVEGAFRGESVERFLKRLDRKGIRVRNFDAVLTAGVLEEGSGPKAKPRELYRALTLSDQAQMREFYLSKLEEVDAALRHKFKKLYQYY